MGNIFVCVSMSRLIFYLIRPLVDGRTPDMFSIGTLDGYFRIRTVIFGDRFQNLIEDIL